LIDRLSKDGADGFASLDMGCGQGVNCAFVPVLNFMQDGFEDGLEIAVPRYVNNIFSFDDPDIGVDGLPVIRQVKITWPDPSLKEEYFVWDGQAKIEGKRYYFSKDRNAFIEYDVEGCLVKLHTKSAEVHFKPNVSKKPALYPSYTWFPMEERQFVGLTDPQKHRTIKYGYQKGELPLGAIVDGEYLWGLRWSNDNHVIEVLGPGKSYSYSIEYQLSRGRRFFPVAAVFANQKFGLRFGYDKFVRFLTAQLWGQEGGEPVGPATHAVGLRLNLHGGVVDIRSGFLSQGTSIAYANGNFLFGDYTRVGSTIRSHQGLMRKLTYSGEQVTNAAITLNSKAVNKVAFTWDTLLDAPTDILTENEGHSRRNTITLDMTPFPSTVHKQPGVARRTATSIVSMFNGSVTDSNVTYQNLTAYGLPQDIYYQNRLIAKVEYEDSGDIKKIKVYTSDDPSQTSTLFAEEVLSLVTPAGYNNLPLWFKKLRPVQNRATTYTNSFFSYVAYVYNLTRPWFLQSVTRTGTNVPGSQTWNIGHEGGMFAYKQTLSKTAGIPAPEQRVISTPSQYLSGIGTSAETEGAVTYDSLLGTLNSFSSGMGVNLSVTRDGRLAYAKSLVLQKTALASLTSTSTFSPDTWGIPIRDLTTVSNTGASNLMSFGADPLTIEHPDHDQSIPLLIPEAETLVDSTPCVEQAVWAAMSPAQQAVTPYWRDPLSNELLGDGQLLTWCDAHVSHTLRKRGRIGGAECFAGNIMSVILSKTQRLGSPWNWDRKYPVEKLCDIDKVCKLPNNHYLMRNKFVDINHGATSRADVAWESDFHCPMEFVGGGTTGNDPPPGGGSFGGSSNANFIMCAMQAGSCRAGSHFEAIIESAELKRKETCKIPGSETNPSPEGEWTNAEILAPWTLQRCLEEYHNKYSTERKKTCLSPQGVASNGVDSKQPCWLVTRWVPQCQPVMSCDPVGDSMLCQPPPPQIPPSPPPGGGGGGSGG
jgi:hypothetical protein